ncbi:hypothetical protein ACIBO5_50545 [Nonomuraea angiospora]|uniref:hypothetical protein n=1 Tax=Nonomuraea angiospora TaxID=46172 RepID=UPI0037992BC0
MADLLGGRPFLGPNGLAVTEAKPATLDGLDTVMRAVETVSAYFTGAIRREIANLRAERATGLHVTKMLATGRFPALAKAVYDGPKVVLRDRPGLGPRRRGRQTHPAAGVTLSSCRVRFLGRVVEGPHAGAREKGIGAVFRDLLCDGYGGAGAEPAACVDGRSERGGIPSNHCSVGPKEPSHRMCSKRCLNFVSVAAFAGSFRLSTTLRPVAGSTIITACSRPSRMRRKHVEMTC